MTADLHNRIKKNEDNNVECLQLILDTIDVMERINDKAEATKKRNTELEERVKALETKMDGESWKYGQ